MTRKPGDLLFKKADMDSQMWPSEQGDDVPIGWTEEGDVFILLEVGLSRAWNTQWVRVMSRCGPVWINEISLA